MARKLRERCSQNVILLFLFSSVATNFDQIYVNIFMTVLRLDMEGLNSSFQWDNHTHPVKMATAQMGTPRPTPFFFQQELSYSTKKVCSVKDFIV